MASHVIVEIRKNRLPVSRVELRTSRPSRQSTAVVSPPISHRTVEPGVDKRTAGASSSGNSFDDSMTRVHIVWSSRVSGGEDGVCAAVSVRRNVKMSVGRRDVPEDGTRDGFDRGFS